MPYLRRLFALLAVSALALGACAPGRPPLAAPVNSTPPTSEIRISGAGAVLPSLRLLADAYRAGRPGVQIIFSTGTNAAGAIRGVAEGSLDLAATSRTPTESEAASSLVFQQYARDAIVFAAHVPGPPAGLTSAQVRDLYGGRVTNWQQVGGGDRPVVVLDRDADENIRKVGFLPIMAGAPVSPDLIVLTSQKEMLTSIDGTPGALGYTTLGLFSIERPKSIVPLQLDGVMPGPQTLIDGRYPWQIPMGLVLHRDAPADVKQFVEYAMTSGPGLLEPYGYARP